MLEDPLGRTVLDAPCRAQGIQLAKELELSFRQVTAEADERRLPYRVEDPVTDTPGQDQRQLARDTPCEVYAANTHLC
jgi:hypothetical protein